VKPRRCCSPALSNQFFSLNLTKTMANLPVTINNFVQSPYAYWKQLAWSGRC
jgi:phosphate transport system permease protein